MRYFAGARWHHLWNGVAGAIVCDTGRTHWTQDVEGDFLRFTRATLLDEPSCLGQGEDNMCYVVTNGLAIADGIAYGNNPVACGLDGSRYIVRGPRTYTKDGVPVSMPLTSQGIRDVLHDGAVVMADATNRATIGGHQFWKYQTRGTITVGQAGTDIGLAVLDDDDYMVIPRAGDPLGVHQALLADGRLAVCAWTVEGAELWLIDLHATPRFRRAPQKSRSVTRRKNQGNPRVA